MYIDEAGEEGFSNSSSEWFVLAGVIHTDDALSACRDTYDAFKRRHMPDNWHFHFQARKHDERLGFISAMRAAPYQPFAVIVRKPSILQPENFRRKYYLYFYALRFLLERATYWASEHAKEPMAVKLSSRGGLEKENLQEYFFKIRNSPFVKDDRVVWSYLIEDQIETLENKTLRGLQLADCVASSIYKALEPSQYGTFEPRYIRELRPMFERHPYSLRSSVKVWPSLGLVSQETRLDWLLRE
jgi:hypothetical protein